MSNCQHMNRYKFHVYVFDDYLYFVSYDMISVLLFILFLTVLAFRADVEGNLLRILYFLLFAYACSGLVPLYPVLSLRNHFDGRH